jgi:hypothetical protein
MFGLTANTGFFLAFWWILGTIHYPVVAFSLALLLVLYQLFAGNLLNLKWGVWVSRKERPRLYWTILAIEAAFCALGIYMASL